MPINCKNKEKPRYRVKTSDSGKKVRLTFCGDKVVEAKSLKEKVKKRNG